MIYITGKCKHLTLRVSFHKKIRALEFTRSSFYAPIFFIAGLKDMATLIENISHIMKTNFSLTQHCQPPLPQEKL